MWPKSDVHLSCQKLKNLYATQKLVQNKASIVVHQTLTSKKSCGYKPVIRNKETSLPSNITNSSSERINIICDSYLETVPREHLRERHCPLKKCKNGPHATWILKQKF